MNEALDQMIAAIADAIGKTPEDTVREGWALWAKYAHEII